MIRYQDDYITLYQGHALDVLRAMDDKSVNCVVTSPPYWSMRDFSDSAVTTWGDWTGQLGQEPTPQMFIDHLLEIFTEARRVLRDDGTMFINLRDKHQGKNLLLIPQRFAIAMSDAGWLLANVIIWHKPNCLPAPAKDRFTVDFEYVFFFAKNKSYYFDQQFEPLAASTQWRLQFDNWSSASTPEGREGFNQGIFEDNFNKAVANMRERGVRTMRSVWSINTKGSDLNHHAMYPEKLAERCILAGCTQEVCKDCGKGRRVVVEKEYEKDVEVSQRRKRAQEHETHLPLHSKRNIISGTKKTALDCCNNNFEPGVVLDPFAGTSTTGVVAKRLQRRSVMIEINPEHSDLSLQRIGSKEALEAISTEDNKPLQGVLF